MRFNKDTKESLTTSDQKRRLSRLDSEDLTEEIFYITAEFAPFFVKHQSVHLGNLKGKSDSAMVECCEQVSVCFINFTKTHKSDKYTAKEIKSELKYLQSKYKYEMSEDVHQVANYLELKMREQPDN